MHKNGTKMKRMMQVHDNENMARWVFVMWLHGKKDLTTMSMIKIEGEMLCDVDMLKRTRCLEFWPLPSA